MLIAVYLRHLYYTVGEYVTKRRQLIFFGSPCLETDIACEPESPVDEAAIFCENLRRWALACF